MPKKKNWLWIAGIVFLASAAGAFAGQQIKANSPEKRALEAALQSASPWMMKMRIFEATRKGEGEPVKSVTSSYLKYSLTATIKTEFDLAEEMKQIQKTFNNPDVKLLTEADFNWKKNDREKAFHMFRLDGREYLVLISPVEVLRRLTFRIEVFEQGEKTKVNLLDTEFTIPEKNITVFGFEDSKSNVYFLSFRVSGWTPAAGAQAATPYVIPAEGPVRAIGEIKPPRLIKQVDPLYPEVARMAGVEGVVILEVETDVYGRVQNTRILRSIPLLDQAAINAVKQWVYEPLLIEGKLRGGIFTVTVRFMMMDKEEIASGKAARGVVGGVAGGVEGGVKGGVQGATVGGMMTKDEALKLAVEGEKLGPVKAAGSIMPPARIKAVDPVYPKEAREAGIEGIVILEAETDVYGRVKNTKILRSVPELDQAAIDAVKQWVYAPFIFEGKPRGIIFTVTVRFTLK